LQTGKSTSASDRRRALRQVRKCGLVTWNQQGITGVTVLQRTCAIVPRAILRTAKLASVTTGWQIEGTVKGGYPEKEAPVARPKGYKAIWAAGLCALALLATPQRVLADEGGVGFWLPGTFGSLAAVPSVPGWSWATIYYHSEVSSGAGAQFPRGGRIDVGISGQADLVSFGPAYPAI
jgi:hypothetical protein